MTISAEQQARDMLERMGIENAQSLTAGQLVELANLIAARAQPEQGAMLALYTGARPDHPEDADEARCIAKCCPKCSSPMAPGHAMESTTAPASHPDHLTDSTGRGTTLRPSGTARLVPVLKCPQCGYSRAQGARSPA